MRNRKMSQDADNPVSSRSTFSEMFKPVFSVTAHENLLETLYRFITLAEQPADSENVMTMIAMNGEVLDHLIKME